MFAKRKKRKRKSFLKKQSDAATAKEPALFSQTFKKFNLRVHPDHFSSYPEQQSTNADSLSLLNGVISDLEAQDTKEETLNLTFYTKTQADPPNPAQPFQRIDIELTGSSRKALASQIGNLFEQCGLPSEFKWDEKYIVTPLWKRDEFAPTADDKRADVNASQKAMKELLHKMDPALQGIAAVPHLAKNDRVRQHIENNVFQDLADMGFRIKHIVLRIWSGERDVGTLTNRLDAEHTAIIKRIVEHANDLESRLVRSA